MDKQEWFDQSLDAINQMPRAEFLEAMRKASYGTLILPSGQRRKPAKGGSKITKIQPDTMEELQEFLRVALKQYTLRGKYDGNRSIEAALHQKDSAGNAVEG